MFVPTMRISAALAAYYQQLAATELDMLGLTAFNFLSILISMYTIRRHFVAARVKESQLMSSARPGESGQRMVQKSAQTTETSKQRKAFHIFAFETFKGNAYIGNHCFNIFTQIFLIVGTFIMGSLQPTTYFSGFMVYFIVGISDTIITYLVFRLDIKILAALAPLAGTKAETYKSAIKWTHIVYGTLTILTVLYKVGLYIWYNAVLGPTGLHAIDIYYWDYVDDGMGPIYLVLDQIAAFSTLFLLNKYWPKASQSPEQKKYYSQAILILSIWMVVEWTVAIVCYWSSFAFPNAGYVGQFIFMITANISVATSGYHFSVLEEVFSLTRKLIDGGSKFSAAAPSGQSQSHPAGSSVM